jgi:cytochrome P450
MSPQKVSDGRYQRTPPDTDWLLYTEVNAHKANTIKSQAYQAMVHSAPNTLTIRHKEDHARRRRILSQAFSDARIASYENIVRRHIDALCDNLEANAQEQQETTRKPSLNMSSMGM